MGDLEVLVNHGNLLVSLPQERGNNRQIILNPALEHSRPQMQFIDQGVLLKAVEYQKTGDGWEPVQNPAFPLYKDSSSVEYRALERITHEAQALYKKFQIQHGF